MRKLLANGLTLLAFACSIAHAAAQSNEPVSPNQCPPASALTHKGFGAHWTVNDTYKKLGWYAVNYPYSDMMPTTYLKDDVDVTAHIRSNENGNTPNWFVTCEYDVHYDAFPRYVVITKNEFLKNAPPLPNFFVRFDDPTDYVCGGPADKLDCAWDSLTK